MTKLNNAPVPPPTLPENLATLFMENAQQILAPAGRSIISQDDAATNVIYITKGKVEITLLAANAKQTLFRELGPGSLLGEMSAIDSAARSANVKALTDVEMHTMPASDFRKLLDEHKEMRDWVLNMLVHRVRDLSQRIFNLSAMDVKSRIWTEILQRMRVQGTPNGKDSSVIPSFPTHVRLAMSLGTHRETVTREMGELKRAEIIRLDGRKLTVLKISALTKLLENYWAE